MHLNSSKNQFKHLQKADVHNHLHLGGSQHRLKEKYPNSNLIFPKKYDELPGMIDFIYNHLNTVMRNDKDVIFFMENAIESAIEDNVTLLEASIDIGLTRFFNNSIEALIDVVIQLKEKYKSQINFKPEIGVNKDLNLEKVYTDGVTCIKSGEFYSIDLYGQEAGKDLNPFKRLYDIAKEHHLKTKAHIGEFSNHKSIEDTINTLPLDEIQHGIRAVDSKHTMDLILKHNIKLNTCPSSNVALSAVSSLKNHPLRTLFDYGIKVTINTDDLILFNATVSDEFQKLADNNIFSLGELDIIRKNALE